MSQKLITVLLFIIAAVGLMMINFINDWLLIVVALFCSGMTLLSASFLLFIRHQREISIQLDQE